MRHVVDRMAHVLSVLCFLLSSAVVSAVATAEPAAPLLPIEQFTQLPDIDSVVASPSGKRLAILSFGPEGRRRLGVIDLDPLGGQRIVAAYENADVTQVHWVNDDRLVYEAFPRGAEVRAGRAGTFAVDHDGSGVRQLIAWQYVTQQSGTLIRTHVLPYGWFFRSTIDDGSDDIFVEHRVNDSLGDAKQFELSRLDTRSGVVHNLSYGMPEGTDRWLMDATHEPRLLTAYRDGRENVYWRAPKSSDWLLLTSFDPFKEAGFEPWFVDEQGQVLVSARRGRDTEAIYRLDPVTKQLDKEPAIAIEGYDLGAGAQVDSKTGHLLGIHFRTDRPTSYWLEPALDRVQRSVDAALPAGRSNRLYCGRCESTRFFVVRSSSDRQPAEYFLFDKEKSSLEPIGASRPWIKEATQATRTFHRVAARDGLTFPVYLTHPVGASAGGPRPAVVLVHGGPFVRGVDLGWKSEAQFLASRGYLVIEPEFRGSTGYGFRLFRAGWKQWGHAMQDDLADAVQWAVREKLADPSRVCIVGGSYGGYAALMGPIADPGVYRCAASFAGVTDIGLMYSIIRSDTSEAAKRYGMPALIGDPDKDAELLDSASPLKRVAEIKVPILLAHGYVDRRVPLEHARAFESAARRAGVAVESVEYPDEGHGFFLPENSADYHGRLERFLARSLQSPK